MYKRWGCVQERADSGFRELNRSHYSVKTCAITLHIIYLLDHKKTADGLLPHSWYTLLETRGVDNCIVRRIRTNTHLNFEFWIFVQILFTYTLVYTLIHGPTWFVFCARWRVSLRSVDLRLWALGFLPLKFASLPHFEISDTKAIGPRTQLSPAA